MPDSRALPSSRAPERSSSRYREARKEPHSSRRALTRTNSFRLLDEAGLPLPHVYVHERAATPRARANGTFTPSRRPLAPRHCRRPRLRQEARVRSHRSPRATNPCLLVERLDAPTRRTTLSAGVAHHRPERASTRERVRRRPEHGRDAHVSPPSTPLCGEAARPSRARVAAHPAARRPAAFSHARSARAHARIPRYLAAQDGALR